MKEFPKQYNFKESEQAIYALWEKSGFFRPEKIRSQKKYTNILPPPNANGELHLGHASGYAVMDIFGRFERMRGKKVLLLPGKDHAGIQTQVVFEKKLKSEGTDARQLGRTDFYRQALDFTLKNAEYMRSQEKRVGISADWSREKFTLDPQISKVAMETFVKMYQDGMVYKGKRIINWCPSCATSLSDLEVIHKEKEGKLYFIKYPFKNSEEFITVATTRPETMLGDTAVAVNPKDSRYFRFIGKTIMLPLMKREIPLITDRRIDMNFGTGAVKITPAHDMLDWQIGKDNNLEEIQVINEQAKITELGGRFKGQSTLEARANILSDLKKLDLFEKEETVKNSISLCERCKAVIEPLVSLQWFINVDAEKFSLKKEAIKSIKAGKINFYPENFKKIMLQWFNGLNDWCISRQIWWGHQFPVWYCQCSSEEPIVSLERPKACPKCGSQKIIQDENTFDTWFSSGQWAYTSLGFPNGSDYKNFYPSQMMVMGRDILFFWAARMVMMSLYRTKNVPFKNIYFTGLIRDREGNKMSKSRDNGIDPLQMIEKFGADALRLSLVMDISAGQDSRLYEEKIENYRNFVTKLWNIARYAKTSVPDFCLIKKLKKNSIKTVSNRWIITNLNQTIEEVTKFMEEKNISLAQERLRNFTWDDFADWYIEINKMEKNPEVIGFVLDKIIRLWHPFAPFVTEKIWQEIEAKNKMLMISEWPQKTACVFPTKEKKYFQDLKNLVTKIRNIKANYRIKPADRIVAYAENFAEKSIIEKLAKIRILKYPKNEAKLVRVEFGDKKIFLDILSKVDLKKELINMERELDVLKTAIEKHKNLLKNPGFLKKAAQEQIVSARERLLGYQTNLKEKNEIMGNFKKLV